MRCPERILDCFSAGLMPLEYLDGLTRSAFPRFASFCDDGPIVSRFIPPLDLLWRGIVSIQGCEFAPGMFIIDGNFVGGNKTFAQVIRCKLRLP